MLAHRVSRWLAGLVLALSVLAVAQPALAADRVQEQVQRQETQPLNNAPVWRDVRGGDINQYQTTQVRGVESSVLVQSEGEIWRQVRNGPITVYGGWLLVAVVLLLGAYFAIKGPIRLPEKPSGRLMPRFSAWDRIVHWSTAITFILLSVTGMITLFGKYVLLPVFGYALFSWIASLAKNLHNFLGPLFAVCTIIMFVTFVKDNLPKAYDWVWVRRFGGMLGEGHVPCGRFNAAEKVYFWLGVLLLGVVISVTGFILNFANFGQGRELMQISNVLHAVSAVLFITMALGHIYLGTIGVEGAYEAMRTGMTDEVWAKTHHQYWYEEMKKGQQAKSAPGGTPAGAPAAAMKDGWKL